VKRTHLVRAYAPPAAPVDPYAPSVPVWTPRGAAFHANLQPLTGKVEQTAAGRAMGATWRAFVPAGTGVEPDDGLVVLEGEGPRVYRVKDVGPQGRPWDTELYLDLTPEVIP